MTLTLLPYEENAVRRTGDRAAQIDQVALDVDLLDPEIRLCVPLGAVMTGHLLALDHARGIGARSDGARPAMLRVAVRVRSAAKAPALHHALEAATLAGAGDLHPLANLEDLDRDRLPNRELRHDRLRILRVIQAEAAQR